MSKKAQRRIIWIVIFSILFSVLGYKLDDYNLEKNPTVSKNEWNTMLAEAFGIDAELTQKGRKDLDGEYIAKTLVKVFDKERIAILSDNEGYEDVVDFAVENGIIARSQVNAPFSRNAAERALETAIDLYYSEKMYPDYADITYKENVVQAEDLKFVSFDDKKVQDGKVSADAKLDKVTVGAIEDVPDVGQIVLFEDEYGIAKARKVVSASENSDGNYDVDLVKVEDISEIAEEISFSGSGDFSSITGGKESAKNTVEDTLFATPKLMACACISSGVLPVFGFWDGLEKWSDDTFGVPVDEQTKSIDIGIGVACSIDHTDTYELKTSVEVDNVKTEFGINSKGMVSGSITVGDGPEIGMEEKEDGEEEDDGKLSGEAKGTISGSIKLENFRVSAKGFFVTTDWLDKDNYIEVFVDTDVVYNLTLSGEVEGKFKLGTIKCPIPFTAGTVSVDVVPYLVVSAEGKISLTWTLEGVHTGVNVSVANGIKPSQHINDVKFEPSFEIQASAGVGGEVAVKFCELDLIDPGFTIKVVTLDMSTCLNSRDYLYYDPCVDIEIRGVDLDLEVCYGSDSATYEMLKAMGLEGQLKFTLINSEETPLYSMKTHMETELDGRIHFEDECTHISENALDELLENAFGNNADKIGNMANSWAEKMMGDFLMDSCSGCY